MQAQGHGELEGVQRPKALRGGVPDEKLLRQLKIGRGHLHDAPQAGGDVVEREAAQRRNSPGLMWPLRTRRAKTEWIRTASRVES